ncbi:LIM domain-binding protein 3-like [Uloborus diversus]|uniref:LIM domain-binding protein 3-like n=1 Tax=Uloborus diversus TaxID=327109 RepID=UPI002408F39A|nr:LIM domain-binding protein 3-like [Uloborus diversus]
MSARRFYVQLNSGAPWGFRLKGGKGSDSPLVIAMVNSKGRQQGLREGDRVVSLNGKSTADMTHVEARREIRESDRSLELQIERCTPSKKMNGMRPVDDCDISQSGCLSLPVTSAEDEANNPNSWSTDSTSTGSTTIHVGQNNSEETNSSEEGIHLYFVKLCAIFQFMELWKVWRLRLERLTPYSVVVQGFPNSIASEALS